MSQMKSYRFTDAEIMLLRTSVSVVLHDNRVRVETRTLYEQLADKLDAELAHRKKVLARRNPDPRRKPASQEQIEQAMELLREGVAIREVARETGLPYSRVWRLNRVWRLGLKAGEVYIPLQGSSKD